VRLATIRTAAGTAAVRLEAEGAVHLGASDVGSLLADPDWHPRAASSSGETFALDDLDYAPLIPRPEKVICVGLNYRNHILEMGHDLPSYPTLFAKFPPTLIGAHDDVVLPWVSDNVDWEVELAVIIGKPVRHADEAAAAEAVAGYSVLNDVSVRDWQNRTSQFLQGKCFEATTPVGPALVTTDDAAAQEPFSIRCAVNGEVMQESDTSQLVFGVNELVRYISTAITLHPGDIIATGTPGGVGHARKPPVYLQDGDVLTTTIEGLGELRNTCRREAR
jgi:acylpyruvate hydrolase